MLKILIISLIFTLSACTNPVRNASVAHTAVKVQNDRRSLGTIFDDGALYLSIYAAISTDQALQNAHLNFLTYDAKVLVTGEVENKENKALIDTLIIEHVPEILKVINETRIAPVSSLLSRAKDTLTTLQVETLFYRQDVFHPAHIKVTTENKAVYLMGKVTKREADKAVKVVKKVSGIEKIVKVFEYLKSRPIAEIKAEQRRQLEAKKQLEIAQQKQALEKQKALIRAEEKKIQQQIDNLDGLKASEQGTRF